MGCFRAATQRHDTPSPTRIIDALNDRRASVCGLISNGFLPRRLTPPSSLRTSRRRRNVAFQPQIDNDVAVMLVVVRGVEQQNCAAPGLSVSSSC